MMASVDWMAPASSWGTSSGEISVARMACRSPAVAAVDVPGRRHEADQVLDQGLRHRCVDVVVGHLIADAVGAPAEPQLGQVAGADHEGAVLVGEPEQIIGPQARLDVLEGHVVDRLARWRRDGRRSDSIWRAAGRMSISAALTAERPHQLPGMALGALAGGEARERVGEDIGLRQAEPVHAPCCRPAAPGSNRGRPRRRSRPSRCRSPPGAWRGPAPGCCRPRSSSPRAWPGRTGRRGSARPDGAGCNGSAGGSTDRATIRNASGVTPRTRPQSPNVTRLIRSWRRRPRSTSATARVEPAGKRSVSARRWPSSKMPPWPSQARSVVDSPGPAAE